MSVRVWLVVAKLIILQSQYIAGAAKPALVASMSSSLSDLGEALLRDPLPNANNAARLLAAIRPDAEAVRELA